MLNLNRGIVFLTLLLLATFLVACTGTEAAVSGTPSATPLPSATPMPSPTPHPLDHWYPVLVGFNLSSGRFARLGDGAIAFVIYNPHTQVVEVVTTNFGEDPALTADIDGQYVVLGQAESYPLRSGFHVVLYRFEPRLTGNPTYPEMTCTNPCTVFVDNAGNVSAGVQAPNLEVSPLLVRLPQGGEGEVAIFEGEEEIFVTVTSSGTEVFTVSLPDWVQVIVSHEGRWHRSQ
jgi:hypothetical protein